MPITSVSDSSVIWFRLKPRSRITKKVGIKDSGMATAAIAVARQLRRNRKTTNAASTMPSSSTCTVASKLARVSSTVETTWVKVTDGCALASTAMASSARFSTATSLASRVLLTWKATAGRLSSRAKPRTSAEPSPTSATSASRT